MFNSISLINLATIDRCHFSTNFVRHCDDELHIKTYYDVTAEECFNYCDQNQQCYYANWHPGYQIWKSDGRTNCWLWKDDANICDWNGVEFEFPDGAAMIRCEKGKISILSRNYLAIISIF